MRRVVAVILDLVAVVVFVAIGRASHHHGESVGGFVSTAWPFLLGAGCGWLVARAWRQPWGLVPSGLWVWLSCVGVGMVLRVLAGQGTAPAFIVVALGFLGLELLGWRVVARLVFGRRRPVESLPGGPEAATH